ncbi:hypothetical protein DWG18_04460 [Lysobacter sp. TY2-98]|uniref:hypothetical protein n=1 Tax=Lysobacter sp. TY2-98 TaxID=2290922 RepID=UPI000E1FE793|nr:hypothetical protein [Lysobacter sp. TY2-98]AXK71616.1 hypothetical protein DWG18_04460 [Lysobacter sp. TY2-98]
MSDLNASSPAPPRRGNGTRYLFMALLGLVVGVVASVMIMNALDARKDKYPEAVMHVMAAHMHALKDSVTQNRCAATDVIPNLQAIRTMSNDIEPAFKDMRDDEKFGKYASDLRAAVDASLATPPLNCPGVQAAAAKLGEACENCHKYVHQ